MLHILPTEGVDETGELVVDATKALWLDLLNPTSAEVTSVEEMIGAALPSLGALSEMPCMLYRSTNCLCRRGAPMKNPAHSASFESFDKDAPSKPGTKHI